MVDGIDRFLLRKTSEAESEQLKRWHADFNSPAVFWKSLAPKRERLSERLGVAGSRITIDESLPVWKDLDDGKGDVSVRQFRLPVLADPDPGRNIASVWCEGIVMSPRDESSIVADVIAVPDCEQTPAEICGLVDGVPQDQQVARHLASRGCRVVVPMLIDRSVAPRGGRARLTSREFIYRSSYVLGRHIIGYEVQKIGSVIDWFGATASTGSDTHSRPIVLIGSREGARLSLYAAALDKRIDAVCLFGDFGAGGSTWSQPVDRNVFGILNEFGDAQLLAMIAPRSVLIGHATFESVVVTGEGGGAPGRIDPVAPEAAQREIDQARQLVKPLIEKTHWAVQTHTAASNNADAATASRFLKLFGRDDNESPKLQIAPCDAVDESAMQQRGVEELDRHNQLLLRESPFVRDELFADLKFDSLETYETSLAPHRKRFRDDVIGHFDDQLSTVGPRLRKTWSDVDWTGYEVVLDVFPDVIAYGVLLVPNDLATDERRPVVVCQHGLEGRPTDTFLNDHRAYHDYAATLAKRGFIVFAPQNPYLFKDRFRTLQRKANPLGKTLFSVINAQHQRVVSWLQEQPFVDPDRIAFYGLSYGGKSAMRIPAVVTDYCLSICSADFNEWVRKNASTRHRFSYVWTGEYEIFEWNLGGTFNYAEMAALICPRPFMVERGHFDGVGTDQWVAYEYAKVRHLYAARLKLPERTEIEWFDGPHMINGEGTFEFLHRHLDWPK